MEKKKSVFFIIIAGGTASGKTTVANKIANILLKDKPVRHWSMDSYYKYFKDFSFEERKKINYDHPNSLDIELLVDHLNKFRQRKAINVPIYDFKNHRRSNKTINLEPADVIILDGILALHIKEIREFGDLKIFIKTEDDVRFIRRLERDLYERGRTIENIIKQYLTTVKPMHDLFVAPSMDLADIIIPYYEGNEVAIDLVVTKVHSILEDKKII